MRAEHLQPFLPWFRNPNCIWWEAPSYQFSVSSHILGPDILLCTEIRTVMHITELVLLSSSNQCLSKHFQLCLLYSDQIKESKRKKDIFNPYAELNENVTVL